MLWLFSLISKHSKRAGKVGKKKSSQWSLCRCLGPHARYTDRVSKLTLGLTAWVISSPDRAGDSRLQLFVLNEEFLVSTGQQPVLITSLSFVLRGTKCHSKEDLGKSPG